MIFCNHKNDFFINSLFQSVLFTPSHILKEHFSSAKVVYILQKSYLSCQKIRTAYHDYRRTEKLYRTYTGHEPEVVNELPSSGSNRRYFRLTGTPTLIGVSGTSIEENQTFLYMADHFRKKGLPVPEVVAKSENNTLYLQEDLGDMLLFNAIEKGRKTNVFDEEEKQLLHKTMRLLPTIQFIGADGMDFSYCYPQSEFNSRSILWDLNYFKYCFLKAPE